MAGPTIKDLAYRTLAGAIGGPVDITSMIMRPFGYSVDQPVLGSEWIGQKLQEQGVISDERDPIQEFLASIATPTPGGLPHAAMLAAPLIAGRVSKIGNAEDALVMAEKTLGASSIKPLNKVEDVNKYKEILESMKSGGWQGRPLLVYDDNGKVKALTGSHRIAAAKKAGIDVPVVFVKPESLKYKDDSGMFTTFKDAVNDDRTYHWLKKSGDEKAANLMRLEN